MRRTLAILAVGTVTLVVAVLIAGGCASRADAPTLTPTAGSSTQASGSGSSDPVDAYIIYRDDTGTLSVRDFLTAKTYHQPVDPTKENIAEVRCTPDGARIAYLKQVFANASQRQVIIRGSNTPRDPLMVPSLVQWIAWSADGNKLAMVEWNGQAQPKHGKLYIYDIATGQQTTILEGDQYIGNIAWSPVGDRLTFYLQSSDFRQADIYTLKIDGSDLKQLTPGDGEFAWYDPAWAPDGTWIIAAGGATGGVQQLYRIDPDSGALTQLTTSNDIYKRNPSFSPDGSLVAFTGQVILPGVSVDWRALHTYGIFTMKPDGSDERALTADPRGTTPGPNDPFLNAYLLGWCAPGPWLDDVWKEAQQ